MTGDGMYAAFANASNAIDAALAIQRSLGDPARTSGIELRLRCGLDTGKVERRDNDLFGASVNRAARIMQAAHGGQILMSDRTAASVFELLPAERSLVDLGHVRLRGIDSAQHVFQLVHPDLRREFPSLQRLEATPYNLPQQLTYLVGRPARSRFAPRRATPSRDSAGSAQAVGPPEALRSDAVRLFRYRVRLEARFFCNGSSAQGPQFADGEDRSPME
jgi:hypothetical protein